MSKIYHGLTPINTGGGLPALIWRDFMDRAQRAEPVRPLVMVKTEPRSVVESLWRRLFGAFDADRSEAPNRPRESDSDGGP